MANIKRTQLSGKLLEIFDKIQLQKESDNAETVKRAKIAEKKFEDKIAELKAKKEKLAKDGKLDEEKKKPKVTVKPKKIPKAKTTKEKKKPFMTKVKEYSEKNNISFADARKELSSKNKQIEKKETEQAKKELDALLKDARKSSIDDLEYTPRTGKNASKPKASKSINDLEYTPRTGKTASNPKAGKTISKSSDGMRQAKPKGKRISKSGKVYYEYRENRSDENSLPTKTGYKYKGKTPPYLEKGGALDDSPYDVMAFKTKARYNSDNSSESLTTKTYRQAVDKALDFIDKGFFKVTIFSKTGYLFEVDENGVQSFEKGGRVISVVNEGEEFDEKKYEAIFGDYDGDGVANIDDISPLDSSKSGKVEQVSLKETFRKLIDIKNQLDSKMYDALDNLDKKAPKNAELYARTKTPYSIVKKLVDKRLMHPTKGLTDMIGTTIAVDNQKDLEKVKKDIQNGSMGKVLDFDDFYKNPNNGYRAYHFIVEYEGTPIEVQLKTKMQKKLNEVSHQFYKDGTLNAKGLDEVSKMVMQADKGDKKALVEVNKLMADKVALEKKLSTSKMAMGGELEQMTRYQLEKEFDKLSYEWFDIRKSFNTNEHPRQIEIKKQQDEIYKLLYTSSKMAMGGFIIGVGTIEDFMLKDLLMKNPKVLKFLNNDEKEFMKLPSVVPIGHQSKPYNIILTDGEQEFEIDLKANKLVKPLTMARKQIKDFYSNKMAMGGTLPTPFGQSGLVGETGTLNEMDLFAMGGDLPQGVHQFYGQTYNPAYPTPYGYKFGGTLEMQFEDGGSLDAINFEKGGQTKKRPKSAIMRDRKYLNMNEKWEVDYAKKTGQLDTRKRYKKRKELGGEVSQTDLSSDSLDDITFAKGGQTKKRPKSAIMRDRKYLNMNEKWEVDYAKKTGQLDTRKRYKKRKELGGEVSQTKKDTPISLAKKIRKEGENWQVAIQRATKILNDKK